jgi:hypothetical protein
MIHGVLSIKDALNKTRTRLVASHEYQELASQIIASELGVEEREIKLVFKEDKVIVKAHPMIKSELFLKKEKILLKLSHLCGKGSITSIS